MFKSQCLYRGSIKTRETTMRKKNEQGRISLVGTLKTRGKKIYQSEVTHLVEVVSLISYTFYKFLET